MIDLFHQASFECSRVITNRYSTSFSLGIKAFDKRFRDPIYAVYGFVRSADEIVDTFHEYDKKQLIWRFRAETYMAVAEGISLNPILNAFQQVVREYQMDEELIAAFFRSMEMDLHTCVHSEHSYRTYIYGSAEVVGLMCLAVFCEGDRKKYEQLRPAACRLGAAFQKVNFLRDMRSDYLERRRMYFPGVSFTDFCDEKKARIEHDIWEDFIAAYEGIKNLPPGCRRGVYIAYRYYKRLFEKLVATPAVNLCEQRVRVADTTKMVLLIKACLRHEMNWM